MSLEEQNCERIFTDGCSRVEELKRFNHSILFNFLELLKILAEAPAQYEEKVKDLELLFVNMHHLINGFRPHQARETIRSVLEYQRDKRNLSGKELRLWLDRARKSIGKCKKSVFPRADEIYNAYLEALSDSKDSEMIEAPDADRDDDFALLNNLLNDEGDLKTAIAQMDKHLRSVS